MFERESSSEQIASLPSKTVLLTLFAAKTLRPPSRVTYAAPDKNEAPKTPSTKEEAKSVALAARHVRKEEREKKLQEKRESNY